MGLSSDPVAVVDPELKVYGLKNLRVKDASIMPMVVSGNTNAPFIMIAQKGSVLIKKHWQPSNVNWRSDFGHGKKEVNYIPSGPINNNPTYSYRRKNGVYQNWANHGHGILGGNQGPLSPGIGGNPVYTNRSGHHTNQSFMAPRPNVRNYRSTDFKSNGVYGKRGKCEHTTTPYEGLFQNDGRNKISDPLENRSGGIFQDTNDILEEEF